MKTSTEKWRKRYYEHIESAGYEVDPAQIAVIDQLARIEFQLSERVIQSKAPQNFFSRLFNKSSEEQSNFVQGLYLYGTVGRGKTFLMDLFCDHANVKAERLHFHHFMKHIHDALRGIKNQQDPLTVVAQDIANRCDVLCLDEFMVTDITDAMLLHGLLKYLTDSGVAIITTSNIIPDDLYKNGLQRERFLPAIPLIKERLVIHEIGGEQDFRRLRLEQHERFFHPLNQSAQDELKQIFDELSQGLSVERNSSIEVNDRMIKYVARSSEVIWFQFESLCEGFRSQLDYIELAKEFPIFIVSEIPLLDSMREDAAKRFLLLVDELYDRRIDLIISSAAPIEEIYQGKKIVFEFDRLQSRLFEMQSKDYGTQ